MKVKWKMKDVEGMTFDKTYDVLNEYSEEYEVKNDRGCTCYYNKGSSNLFQARERSHFT